MSPLSPNLSVLEKNETFSTVELAIHFFRPVRVALISATGKVGERSSRLGYVESTLTDEHGRLIAKATSTCLIRKTEGRP